MCMQVRRISQLVLKREHAFIDMVGLGSLETPAKVLSKTILTSLGKYNQEISS